MALGVILTISILAMLSVRLWDYLTPSVEAFVIPGPESVTNSLALHTCRVDLSPKLNGF